MNIYVRPIDMNDLPQFWAVRREAQQNYGRQIKQKDHSFSFWNERVANDIEAEGVIFFAEQDNQLLGTIALAQTNQSTLIWGLYVRHTKNRDLIAKSLLSTAQSWSTEKKINLITIPLLTSNRTAYQFYQEYGFYQNNQETAQFWANGTLHQEAWLHYMLPSYTTPNHLN